MTRDARGLTPQAADLMAVADDEWRPYWDLADSAGREPSRCLATLAGLARAELLERRVVDSVPEYRVNPERLPEVDPDFFG